METIIKVGNATVTKLNDVDVVKGKLVGVKHTISYGFPIVINEEIEYDFSDQELVYNTITRKMETVDSKLLKAIEKTHGHSIRRILLFTDNLRSENLSMIEKSELKSGDYVYVEVYRRGRNSSGVDADLTGGVLVSPKDYWCVKLNKFKHKTLANITPAKETWDHIISSAGCVSITSDRNELVKYLNKNYNLPKRKV